MLQKRMFKVISPIEKNGNKWWMRCGSGFENKDASINLYLNALDWAVNDPAERGQPVLVRYADDFVILCATGQGAALRQRLTRWLAARGLGAAILRPDRYIFDVA